MAKRGEAPGREGEIGLEEALELEEGLVVEDDVIDVGERQPCVARQYSTAFLGKRASCFLRVKRSSCAAATILPSRSSAAALS